RRCPRRAPGGHARSTSFAGRSPGSTVLTSSRSCLLELGRTLCRVRMLATGVHVELAHHLLAQPVLREHPANRPADHFLRAPREKPLETLGPHAAGVPGVAHVLLRLELLSGDLDLGCVEHDDRIAGVDVRRERRAVLPTKQRRDTRREATQRRAIGVDDAPLSLDLSLLHRVCLRHHSQFSLPSCRLRSPSPYRTATRHRPFAGALGPARARSFAASTSAKAATVSFRRPTHSSVPTMPRTIPRRKASDSISKRRTLSSPVHSARFTVRSPDSPAANAAKSWRPTR